MTPPRHFAQTSVASAAVQASVVSHDFGSQTTSKSLINVACQTPDEPKVPKRSLTSVSVQTDQSEPSTRVPLGSESLGKGLNAVVVDEGSVPASSS